MEIPFSRMEPTDTFFVVGVEAETGNVIVIHSAPTLDMAREMAKPPKLAPYWSRVFIVQTIQEDA